MPKINPKTPEQRAWVKGRNKYPSGFCNDFNKAPQCEGTKPKSAGKPVQTCPFWLECPCECHWNVDQLFAMTGAERKPIPNPEYVHTPSGFLLPEVTVDPVGDVALDVAPVIGHDELEQPSTAPSGPATAPLAQRRTPTGRAARGGLEAQVWDACNPEGMLANIDPLTPKIVGQWIASRYKIPTPSSGAINAVWDRWEKLGFAKFGKKPNRFLGFEGEGTWEQLMRIKASKKRLKKSAASQAKRGFRST